MEALGLNITDWFILVVLTASGLISLARGFTKEFLSLFLYIRKIFERRVHKSDEDSRDEYFVIIFKY